MRQVRDSREKETFLTLKTLTAALAGSLALAALGAAPAAAQPPAGSDAAFRSTTLSLNAQGVQRSRPDQASINLGVQTEAPTAAEALRQNSTRMNAVMTALRRAGIEERQIQTSGLSLQAQYDYRENQPPRLRGYQASNQVTVTVNDLARLGPAVDAVVASGANQINGISFGLQNADQTSDAARREAVEIVRRRAELYAQAAGLRVVRLINITESGGYTPQPPMPIARFAAVRAESADTPVAAGEVEVRVDVNATFELGR